MSRYKSLKCETCGTNFCSISLDWPCCPECKTSAQRQYVVAFTIIGNFSADKNAEYKFKAIPPVSTNEIRRYVSDENNTPYHRIRLDDVRILPIEVIQ